MSLSHDIASPPSARRGGGATFAWLVAALVALWGLLIYQLQPDWNLNPQYSYGWLVPMLTAYLLWQAWERRPAFETPKNVGRAWVMGGVLLVLFFPLLPIREANPDWRLVSWLLAGQVITLTLLAIYQMGGRAWLRHFSMPLVFFLVAVPWPSFVEIPLVQGMMRLVAALAVEIMVWVGIPAEANGNVIVLSRGVVGIDEACSGVRSLQSVIMSALFLGELFLLGAARRLGLLLVGLVAAFCGNLIRSTVLVWIAGTQGMEAIEDWHDTAGYSVLVVSLLILGLVAWWWRDRQLVAESTSPSPKFPAPWTRLPIVAPVCVLVVLGLSWALSESWFRYHEMPQRASEPWALKLPRERPNFEEVTLPETTQQILRADSSRSGQWTEPDGRTWAAHFFRWEPGRNAAQLARLHRPEVCLPASGAQILSAQSERLYQVDGIAIPFRHYAFSMGGTIMHTFHTLWGDQVRAEDSPTSDWSTRGRLRAVGEGRRNQGQQVMQVVLPGGYDLEEAQEAFQRRLPELIEKRAAAP